jgi:hypothetical protein
MASKLNYPPMPTADQCSKHERLPDFNNFPAFACWYPSMGGYVGKAIVVITPDVDPGENVRQPGDYDRCFDVYVWHNGKFPFSDDEYDQSVSPIRLHHCCPSEFIEFGEFVIEKQKEC